MLNKRIWGPLLSLVLIAGVGMAIYFSARDQLLARRVVTVRGLIGSEKEEFFKDERVVEILRRNGIQAIAEKAGSRQIATAYDLAKYDFGFPAGVPAAEKIRREHGVSKFYTPFFTPMAVASWKPIAQILVDNGLAVDRGGYYTLDMAAYLDLVRNGTRWSDLTHNQAYDVNKSVLITSTDIRKSNSAAMYLSLASFVANGDKIVQDQAAVRELMPLLEQLFLGQGFTEYSSEAPFEDYLVMGMGKAPLVMIYEAQFLARAADPQGGIDDEMVLIYPTPTIFTKHIFLPLTPDGERLGELLETNPELQRLAVEHGFRNNDAAAFREFVATHKLSVPDAILDVIEPPSYEIVEDMIVRIEERYQ